MQVLIFYIFHLFFWSSPAHGYLNATDSHERIYSRHCDSFIFHINSANLLASNALEYYANWTIIHRNDPRCAGLSEVGCFGRLELDVPNYDCSFSTGCTDMPDCNTILENSDGDVALAMKRYFIMNWHRVVNNYFRVLDVCLPVRSPNAPSTDSSSGFLRKWKTSSRTWSRISW
jgi:hypothetical protein